MRVLENFFIPISKIATVFHFIQKLHIRYKMPYNQHMHNKDAIILDFAKDRKLAHAVLFRHRHPSPTPPYLNNVIDSWHSPISNLITMIFRGGAKSTISEEGVILALLLQEFKNCVIVGSSETRAKERLTSIKHELETNEFLQELFGDQIGAVWTETKIVAKNGVCVQAHGYGQSLRGLKHLQWRPDLLIIDDLEDADNVATPEARSKMASWFVGTLRGVLAPKAKIRMAATPLNADALAVNLTKTKGWNSMVIPIERIDPETGARVPTWPERFPLSFMDERKDEAMKLGKLSDYAQEYMCEATPEGDRAFLPEYIKVVPQARTWQATWAFYDPARTTKATSAHTGKVVWSWIKNRLVVWESSGNFWKPDEMIDDMFATDTRWQPVAIGVENDGLHEFIEQPMRHEQTKRRHMLPIVPMRAPKGKLTFIKSLQPYFKAGEIEFACDQPELREQLLAFPTGRMDVPNALAYALRMKPGALIYDEFENDHIAEISYSRRDASFVAVNSNASHTAAALFQMTPDRVLVLADCVAEGDAGSSLAGVIATMGMMGAGQASIVAPSARWQSFDTSGLRAAAARVPVQLSQGGTALDGREELRAMMLRRMHGQPCMLVSPKADWTLRALAGGYARSMDSRGLVSDLATDGPYKVLMEGLEAAVAMRRALMYAKEGKHNYSYTRSGQRYISAMPR